MKYIRLSLALLGTTTGMGLASIEWLPVLVVFSGFALWALGFWEGRRS